MLHFNKKNEPGDTCLKRKKRYTNVVKRIIIHFCFRHWTDRMHGGRFAVCVCVYVFFSMLFSVGALFRSSLDLLSVQCFWTNAPVRIHSSQLHPPNPPPLTQPFLPTTPTYPTTHPPSLPPSLLSPTCPSTRPNTSGTEEEAEEEEEEEEA